MKKSTAALAVTGGLFAAAGALAFMIAPSVPKKSEIAPFYGRNYAHRGLHKRDRSVPENSLEAFKAAAEAGYGVELDVRLTADNKTVVFHDDRLSRICGVSGCVEILNLDEVRQLRLYGTEHGIPLLSEVLDVMAGRGPVIIELKRSPRNRELCRRTLCTIRESGARVCVQSFDPTILRWFRKNAPDILRGQLTNSKRGLREDAPGFVCSMLSKMLLNFLSRPNYIAHGMEKKNPLVRLCEKKLMRVSWTSHSPVTEAASDAVIFEYYRPEPRFKSAL